MSFEFDLVALPGVATPSDSFAALAHAASVLKLFPAEATPPEVVKAWRAVLPKDAQLFPVGGITPERFAPSARPAPTGSVSAARSTLTSRGVFRR